MMERDSNVQLPPAVSNLVNHRNLQDSPQNRFRSFESSARINHVLSCFLCFIFIFNYDESKVGRGPAKAFRSASGALAAVSARSRDCDLFVFPFSCTVKTSQVKRGSPFPVGGHVELRIRRRSVCVWCLFFSSVQKPYDCVGVSGQRCTVSRVR